MNAKYQTASIGFAIAIIFVALLGLAACTFGKTPEPTPAPLPTLSLDETSAQEFVIADFDAVHAPVNGDANQYLIFGSLPVSEPPPDLPPELAVLLGRWEGYSYAPPVKKDYKLALMITEMTARDGKLVAWSGYNLQYPDRVGEIHFRVISVSPPSIEFQAIGPDGVRSVDTFTYDDQRKLLIGWLEYPDKNMSYGPFELSRDQTFYVYKDYAQYLTSKRIYTTEYTAQDLQRYGKGYMIYLPEGYEDKPGQTWPLIFFLHGYGDRGDNLFLLAKASPFMYIREKGSLPCIIVAPLLKAYDGFSSFPEEYMESVLAEIEANYRVDTQRIYLTGLSMGGEAAYRFAVHQPAVFAAIAPLSAYIDSETYSMLEAIKSLPVWAIHGADDTVVPFARGQQPADALEQLGGNVRFTILEGHDHDTWTDTYSDPAFYDWLFQYHTP